MFTTQFVARKANDILEHARSGRLTAATVAAARLTADVQTAKDLSAGSYLTALGSAPAELDRILRRLAVALTTEIRLEAGAPTTTLRHTLPPQRLARAS